MTKLRLGPIADEKSAKITLELSGYLMRDLGDYAVIHAEICGMAAPLPLERLVPAMIERFIAGDRELAKRRNANRSRARSAPGVP